MSKMYRSNVRISRKGKKFLDNQPLAAKAARKILNNKRDLETIGVTVEHGDTSVTLIAVTKKV